MQTSVSHQKLAEKFVFKKQYKNVLVGDALIKLVKFCFTEEEAEIVNALSFVPTPPFIIARRVKRPVAEVAPILKSLADRLMIISTSIKGRDLYCFAMMVPGIYELQMLRSKNKGADIKYFTEFAKLAEEAFEEMMIWAKPKAQNKDLRFMRVIAVEKAIEQTQGILPISTDLYSEIADRNTSFCLANVCACRQKAQLLGEGCGRGMDVCSAVGLAADMAEKWGLGRKVSKEEFIEAKMRAAELGLVNVVDNINDPVQLCSCCVCCCAGLKMIKKYNIPTGIVASHFEASIDEVKCIGCGKCAKICPMDAISTEDKTSTIDYARCLGCGLCVMQCEEQHAITLKERKDFKPPSDNFFSYLADRRRELADEDKILLPNLKLSLGSVFSKIVPIAFSGPKYKPRK